MSLLHLDYVAYLYLAFREYLSKNTFPGHYTISDLLKNGATGMAFLSNLSDTEHNTFSYQQFRSNRQGRELNTLCCKILSKISRNDIDSHILYLVNALPGEETDLPVHKTQMGVILEALVLNKKTLFYVVFLLSFIFTHIY